MVDLRLEAPATEPGKVDTETLAAIDRGTEDANAGRTVSLEEARQLIPEAALRDLEAILAYSWASFPDTAERFGNA